MSGFIDEYMLKLGATVDQSGMARFQQALREASTHSAASFGAIAQAGFKAQTEIVSGFAAIGTAALGLVDKVAMADQSYRLFALHMYMSKDAARGLKVAMDALDQPLENLTWDKELRERAHQLLVDQRSMAPNGDFEGQMRKVRDIRFEFTRMEVEAQYLAMHVVEDFLKALGVGPDELLNKLKGFNDWVTRGLPEISGKIVTTFMPVWHDVEDVFKATWEAIQATALAFTNLVGLLSDDDSLEGKTADFEKFGAAVAKVAHVFAVVVEAIAHLEEALAHMVGAAGAALHGDFDKANYLLSDESFSFTGSKSRDGSPGGSSAVHSLIDKYAASFGVDPSFAHAVAMTESGERQSAVSSTGAVGVMQLMRGTADGLGVNRDDAEDNVKGGVALLAHLLQTYHGSVPYAIAAYHEGEPKMNSILAGRATLSTEARSEVAAVMARMGKGGDVQIGSITVHVPQNNAVNRDVGLAVASEIRAAQNKRTQRNLYEFQDLSPSY